MYILKYIDPYDYCEEILGVFDDIEKAYIYRNKILRKKKLQAYDKDKTNFEIEEVKFNPMFEEVYSFLEENNNG